MNAPRPARRLLAPLLAALLALSACGTGQALAGAAAPRPGGSTSASAATVPPPAVASFPPRITADAAVLIDARTGRILWGRDAEESRHPASTTKMMTALVALQLGRPDDVVTVSPAADATPGSSAHIRTGERYTLANLITAMLLRSGNDASVAIAEHIAGSVPAFAALMNAEATRLGLSDTHFTNPHGLTEPLHKSSALDLARIARAGLAVPAFAAVVDSAEATITGRGRLDQEIRRELHTTNQLLVTYDWVDGVKTGTTSAAGNCLVASGSRGGMRLIAVVLHSDDRWGDAVRLLQWGFARFSPYVASARDQVWTHLPVADARSRREQVAVVAGERLQVPVALSELPRVHVRVTLPKRAAAPLRAGEPLGSLTLLLGTETLESVPLVAASGVARASLPRRFLRHLLPWV